MSFLTGIFILSLAGITAGTIGEIVKAISRRGAGAQDILDLKAQVAQYASTLEEASDSIASQAAQLAELQERVDFAERALAQVRSPKVIGPGAG